MFTSVDKALAAVLAGIIYLLQQWFKLDLTWLLQFLTPETISNLIPILTPIFVWAVPNKPKVP